MFLQLLLTGVALGSMYALVAIGYHITYATSRTVNFSQGDSVMVGAVLAYTCVVRWGWPFWPALTLTLLALAVYGLAVERIAVRPFFRASSIAWLMSTIAVGIIAENVALLFFGTDARTFPSRFTEHPIFIGGAGVYPQELLIPGVGLLVMIGLRVFFQQSLLGKGWRAVAFDPVSASLMGINVTRTIAASYALSTTLAGLAGILLAPIINVSATMGVVIGLKAFAVAILGGLEGSGGIILAGLGYGILEAFIAGYISTALRDIVGFALVILVLAIRPAGLFGTHGIQKV
ncbi:MAG: branched-chain amino acid ABC transporter permease [Candidatus Methylomirabilales bacterium]